MTDGDDVGRLVWFRRGKELIVGVLILIGGVAKIWTKRGRKIFDPVKDRISFRYGPYLKEFAT